ncbi:MAG: hypothetical protein ABIR67_02970 [Gaiellaceae bacterium]
MSRGRWLAFAGLTAALALYTAGADRLWDAERWPDLLFLTLVLFPVTFALIWLLLPLREHRLLLPVGLTLVALAGLFHFTELDVLLNLAKLFALVCIGFWFLSWFENVMWAALIAVVIPWVDAISVWRGPTEYVVEQQPHVFDNVSIAFRVPGEDNTANLGPPDILFFALFLAAADRFALRLAWTWLAMAALLGATLILAATTDVAGLPALPAICVGFLLPNADLLWTALRRRGRAPGRIYGRTDERFYDLDADVIERTPSKVVLLTRDQPPVTASVEPVDAGTVFTVEPEPGRPGILCRLTLGGADEGVAAVFDLPQGLVIVPQDDVSSYLDIVHPEQLAADEDKVERLKRERR